MHIFLIGFMCSGKTTLGQALAKRLSLPFVDLDQYVEDLAGMSVSEIFATSGEAAFRQMEARALADLADSEPSIVACGGGTPCSDKAWEVLGRDSALTVWLRPDNSDRLVHRLIEGRSKRPLIAGIYSAEDMLCFAQSALEKREPYYSKADAAFDSSYLENEEEIAASVDKFIDLLSQYGK